MNRNNNITYLKKCKICESKNLKKVVKIEKQFLSATFVKSNYKNPLTKIYQNY